MTNRPLIVWFQNDLRLADQAAVHKAAESGAPLLALYVLDEKAPGRWVPGSASRWWLHHSLVSLAASLGELGAKLILRRGAAERIIPELAHSIRAKAVLCSRSFEPWAQKRETAVRDALAEKGVALERFDGLLLHDPDRLRTRTGAPYTVFTPFWHSLASLLNVQRPRPAPRALIPFEARVTSDELADWKLLPMRPDWAQGLRDEWRPGEAGAKQRLRNFLDEALSHYAEDRDRPDRDGTSRLSPHLHFGEISPRQCWYAANMHGSRESGTTRGAEAFLRELAWREFSYHLLYHSPDLPEAPYRREFEAFPWNMNPDAERAWQRGMTGYPIVDAGMRELWATGFMHNRVRMIVASFLIKDLLIPWQRGEAWFWDTLVDADLANNAANWQWVAGSGADAAPFFRVFNPVTQGERFDADGAYVRRWVPELARLPAKAVHAPWTAHASMLRQAGVVLGETYPYPIVDHARCRAAALAAFETIKAR